MSLHQAVWKPSIPWLPSKRPMTSNPLFCPLLAVTQSHSPKPGNPLFLAGLSLVPFKTNKQWTLCSLFQETATCPTSLKGRWADTAMVSCKLPHVALQPWHKKSPIAQGHGGVCPLNERVNPVSARSGWSALNCSVERTKVCQTS